MLGLFFNRRHLVANATISIILISQEYTKIPSAIRATSDWLILFRLNPADFLNVHKDISMLTMKEWTQLLDYVFEGKAMNANHQEKKYDNMGIWVHFDKYFKNFTVLR